MDSNVPREIVSPPQDYISPNKIAKTFSLTSVISNVKSKALSLVKSSDDKNKHKKMTLNAEVARRAMSLLNTPPDSGPSTPVNKQNHEKTQIESNSESKHNVSIKRNREPIALDKTKARTTNSTRRNFIVNTETDSDNESSHNEHKYYKAVVQQSSKSIENLIKSPARRPLSANADYNATIQKYTNSKDNLLRSHSATNISNSKADIIVNSKHSQEFKDNNSDIESSENIHEEEPITKDILSNPKQTKGVLKNASSTSSLNKKKVLFDMDAIQMKSLSASPSQSLTEKSDGNEKYELGLINLDGEEWDISR